MGYYLLSLFSIEISTLFSMYFSTGIQQAKATGDRIVALNLPYQLMVRSTMTRAQQTGDYILTRMQPGSVAIKDDKILEEGSPYPAEPSNGSWKPEVNVSLKYSKEYSFRSFLHFFVFNFI